jgi:hypothetical protein
VIIISMKEIKEKEKGKERGRDGRERMEGREI